MKKVLLLIAIIFIGVSASAQKCNFLKNEVDEFTGQKIVITDLVNINKKFTSRHFFSHFFQKNGDGHFIGLRLTGGGQSLFISKGNKCLLKLNNDEIITLEALIPFKTEFKTMSGVSWSYITPIYPTTEEGLKKIAEVGIKKIRMETSESYYDSDVTSKDNKTIASSIECLLKE